ncbi:MAG: hypothetical protein HQ582_07995, partial [Planctomycetes bacterium]|nr:hypothetical protein [Planctomycetota bacterium]
VQLIGVLPEVVELFGRALGERKLVETLGVRVVAMFDDELLGGAAG